MLEQEQGPAGQVRAHAALGSRWPRPATPTAAGSPRWTRGGHGHAEIPRARVTRDDGEGVEVDHGVKLYHGAMPHIAVNGGVLAYEVHGPPDADSALLLLHGLGSCAADWEPQRVAFEKAYTGFSRPVRRRRRP